MVIIIIIINAYSNNTYTGHKIAFVVDKMTMLRKC